MTQKLWGIFVKIGEVCGEVVVMDIVNLPLCNCWALYRTLTAGLCIELVHLYTGTTLNSYRILHLHTHICCLMVMMKFIRHSGSTVQYNTMQSNVKKQIEKK